MAVTVEFEQNLKDFEQSCPYPTDNKILGLAQTEENHKEVWLIRHSNREHPEYKSKSIALQPLSCILNISHTIPNDRKIIQFPWKESQTHTLETVMELHSN
jgi:hypothetical protein